ncbi:hypothetical protein [Paenibacillus phytohabitans]|nr:hypothetical protein [Paenibacillus phytohabitans]
MKHCQSTTLFFSLELSFDSRVLLKKSVQLLPCLYHTAHDLKLVCNNKPDILDMYKRLMNSEYDSVLGYRVMEALRNFVQHRGLPVHVISHKTSRTDDNRIKHLIIPIIRINDLESDGKFKKKLLEELKEEGDKLDIRLYIRQYIQSFYKFQKFIREILAEEVQNNDNLVTQLSHQENEPKPLST